MSVHLQKRVQEQVWECLGVNMLCFCLCMKRSIVCEGLCELSVCMKLSLCLSGVHSLVFSQELWDRGRRVTEVRREAVFY